MTNSERPWVEARRRDDRPGRLRQADEHADQGFRRHGPAAAGPEPRGDLVHGAGLPDDDRPGEEHRSTAAPRPIRDALPPWLWRTVAGTSDQGAAPDQATQVTDALRVAYCQPGVAAFFNFEIADEPSLDGWQSGLLWTDGTPKPSYDAFKACDARRSRRGTSTARATRSSLRTRRSGSLRGRHGGGGGEAGEEEASDHHGSVASAGMDVRAPREAEPFTTADGSTIRELLGLPTAPVQQPEPRRGDPRAGPGDASATTTPRARRSTTSSRGRARWRSTATAAQVGARRRDPDPARRLAPDPARTPTALRFLCCCAPAVPARGHVLRVGEPGRGAADHHRPPGDPAARRLRADEAAPGSRPSELGVDRIYNWDHFFPLSGDARRQALRVADDPGGDGGADEARRDLGAS